MGDGFAGICCTRGLDPATMVTRGYWKLGAVDYTDHDYGTDD